MEIVVSYNYYYIPFERKEIKKLIRDVKVQSEKPILKGGCKN